MAQWIQSVLDPVLHLQCPVSPVMLYWPDSLKSVLVLSGILGAWSVDGRDA